MLRRPLWPSAKPQPGARMWSSRWWRVSRRDSPFLSLSRLSTCAWILRLSLRMLSIYDPRVEVRKSVSFGLYYVLFTAASDSEGYTALGSPHSSVGLYTSVWPLTGLVGVFEGRSACRVLGMVFEGKPACRVWTGVFLSLYINFLELRAVFLALIHFLPSLKGCHVIVRMDNMAVVSHINRHGGSQSCTLNKTCTSYPPLDSGQVPLLESGSRPRSLEPRSRLSVETEAQVGGVDLEPPNVSPDLGIVWQSRSRPLCVEGVVPMPTFVLPEFPGTSGHRCVRSHLAGH